MAVGYAPSLPLSIDAEDGAYLLIKNSKKLIQQNFKMLLLTAPGERIMEPNYGVGLRRYLFEPDTFEIKRELYDTIVQQARRYIPAIKIVRMVMLTSDDKRDIPDNSLQLRIIYTIPFMKENAFIDITLAISDSDTI